MLVAIAEPDFDLLARCAAALDVCGDDAHVCLTTAARVYRWWLPQVADEIHVAAAEVDVRSRQMVRSRRLDVCAHRRELATEDRTTVCGVPMVSAARTWVDLAAVLSLPDLVAAGDSALRSGTTAVALADAVQRSGRRRGVRSARYALGLLNGRSRSRAESHLWVAASAPDLPSWKVNTAVYRAEGGWLAEPDLSLPDAMLALEYKGADHAKLERMRSDLSRGTDLRRNDWKVIEYGPVEVFGRPWEIGPEVRAIVRRRAPHLLGERVRGHARRTQRVVDLASSGP